jgi:hypothetical protein
MGGIFGEGGWWVMESGVCCRGGGSLTSQLNLG